MRHDEAGETLLEIVIAIVVIGIVFSAFFAAYSTAATTSSTHRTAAQADALLRNAAEATKSAVRNQCASHPAPPNASVSTPGATYSVTLPAVPSSAWSPVSMTPADTTCPAVPSSSSCSPTTVANASNPIPCLKLVTFSVTAPGGAARTLTIEVRTP